MIRVRAKFRCISATRTAHMPDQENLPVTYRFQPMYDDSVPEDQRYARYTPSGSLEMLVDNPGVEFELGRDYYLDFTLVEQAAA
jgi:hypothetical protein